MKSIHDVAEHAGVSSATVSRYLNNSGYVGKKTRERISQAIIELDYMPNTLARALHTKSTLTIGLLLPDIVNVFWTSVARGAEDEARKHGYNLILCNVDSDIARLEDYITVLLQRQVDGLIYVPIDEPVKDSLGVFEIIHRKKTPAVILDYPLPGSDADTILGDSRYGAYQLTELLISMGHRKIAIITGDKKYYTSNERLQGALSALKRAKIKQDKNLIYHSSFSYHMDESYEAAREILKRSDLPTAFFAGNNMVALGIIQAVRDAGYRIPEDFSLVCFDDIPQASIIDPFLTVAAQPAYEIGEMASRLLIQRIRCEGPQEPQTVVFPVKIIQRRSCIPLAHKSNNT
jgi:LacI family transcriptional regulator